MAAKKEFTQTKHQELVIPNLKRYTQSETARPRPTAVPRSDYTKTGKDRSAYRRVPLGTGGDKKADVGASTGDVEFRGGFGRGCRPQ